MKIAALLIVSFHGNLDTPLPASPGQVEGKILVCYGAVDRRYRRDMKGFFGEIFSR